MTERGESPPVGGHNMVGEGAGHKGKRGKGCGYARSTHMKGDVGPTHAGSHDGGGSPHTGIFKTAEHKGHGSAHKLPGEEHIGFRKGIDKGDTFESEIKEHFTGHKGVAGINKTAMHSKNPHVTSEGVSHDHGHVSGKAEHLTQRLGETYKFKQPMAGPSHSFGHSHEQKAGNLRLSGHKSAHRIGSRSSLGK